MRRHFIVALYTLLTAAIFLPRVTNLDTFLSPDEPQWERNTQNFVAALKTGDTKNFYQQPHPGITTQWLGALSIHKLTWGEKRLPLALFLSAAVLYVTYILRRGWGDAVALAAGFFLAFNPLLIAHSRVLAMDALLGLCSLAAIVHHLLWIQKKRTSDIALTGIFSALAILSKLSAFGLVIYIIVGTILAILSKKISWPGALKGTGICIGAGLVTTIILFPTILTNFSYVWQGSMTFFATEHFQQQVHALGQWWYPQAFLLWTTPLQILGLVLVPFALYKKNQYRLPILLFLLFSLIFFLEIQYSIKKGDRYMLPVFVSFDIITAFVLGTLGKKHARLTLIVFIGSIVWQGYQIMNLHPYELSYRNPWFADVAQGRTMGWGEGLDLAAQYLNKKPDPENLLVAAYYEGSFAYHFKGKFTSAERLGKETAEQIGADYVVLYRTMQGRAPQRWETKVLKEYADKTPEHIITLNNEEYVWIYKVLP